MLTVTFLLMTVLHEVSGSITQARQFKKIGLPSTSDLQNHVDSHTPFSGPQCSKACVDYSGCKSFALSTAGECRLYTVAFSPGSNTNTDMAYYIRRGEDFNCVREIGFEYNGYLSTSQSGTSCLKWTEVQTVRPGSSFIDGSIVIAENFCREPSLSDARPWCHVTSTSWEYCNIDVCCLPYDVNLYMGNVSFTEAGIACQRWDAQHPHTHEYDTSTASQDYCRASTDTPGRTWCYTLDPGIRWQFCAFTQC